MKTFKETIIDNITCEKPIGMIIRYNTRRVDKRIKHFVFVEGRDDKLFYSCTKDEELVNAAAYFYSVRSDYREGDEKIVGKSSVLYCFKHIKNNKTLCNGIGKCVFIVDKDYDPLLQYTPYNFTEEEKHYIRRTEGYSFENFYILQENLQFLFKALNLSEEDVNEFVAALEKMWKSLWSYYAAKAAITLNYYNNGIPKYSSKHKSKDIFVFSRDIGIDFEKKRQETQKMLDHINTNSELQDAYKALKKILKNDPYQYMRGHDVYDYLLYYLQVKHGFTISSLQEISDYSHAVSKMTVNMIQ